ncbi:MAG: hypothetical protein VYB38_02045 [Bacteroidota bacterium]|nr:hypothetical protein [Bacteroidota bacterium]
MYNNNLKDEIELGWDGPESSLTMDELIEAKKPNRDDRVESNSPQIQNPVTL